MSRFVLRRSAQADFSGEPGNSRFIPDLGGISYVSSPGITPDILDVFEISGLLRIIKTAKNREPALRWVGVSLVKNSTDVITDGDGKAGWQSPMALPGGTSKLTARGI